MRLLLNWTALLALLLCSTGRVPAQDEQDPERSPILTTPTVKRAPNVVERGTLEPAESHWIVCQVRPNAHGMPKIKWVIEEGQQVKKGDLLVELDDSPLQEQLKEQELRVDQARDELTAAEEERKLLALQNQSAIKDAEVTLELAQVGSRKFEEGDAELLRKEVKARIVQAEADLAWRAERLAQAQQRLKDGKATEGQVKARLLQRDAAAALLDKVQMELNVLEKYTLPETKRQWQVQIERAGPLRERAQVQAASTERQARQACEAKRTLLKQQEALLTSCKEDVARCKLTAPKDGLVIYFIPEQVQRGTPTVIAPGEPVAFGQKLLSIPDLSQMVVLVRVHESKVTQVRKGQIARIRVDAFPDRVLKGHVKEVGKAAERADARRPDVRVYPVMIEIDERGPGLKPGMSAEVTIASDRNGP